MNANEKQIGGDHYKTKAIQPWDYIASNGLGYFEGNIVKYVTRWRDKGGVADLEKAQHYLQKLLEVEMQAEQAKDGWTPEAVKEAAFPKVEDADGWVKSDGVIPCDGERVVEVCTIGGEYKCRAELLDWDYVYKWRPAY
jgi:hypothetical protein